MLLANSIKCVVGFVSVTEYFSLNGTEMKKKILWVPALIGSFLFS